MVLLAVIALGVPLAISLRDRVDAEVRSQARSQADVVAATASELVEPGGGRTLERLVARSAETVRGRVIVVDRSGELIADSAGGGELGVSYASRPEIARALTGESDQRTRHSSTLSADILATAVPVVHGGGTVGAVRVTQSVEAVNAAVDHSVVAIALLALAVLAIAIVVGALIAQRIARPITRLADTADRVTGGDLGVQAAKEGTTEQRSLARSFNEMTTRLSRLLSSQQEFVADASHQLRTPLTGLRLQLEELQGRPTASAEEREALDGALHEVDRLSAIVDELLILSRAGEHERPGQRVLLSDVADRLAQRWRRAAEERGLRLVRRSDDRPAAVFCAPADLDRALDALIENAVRYSPAGGEVSIADRPGAIEICDQGPGLARGEEEAVMERFYRGRAGRRGPAGTGLGLPIARELAGQWGGSVAISNRSEGGARAVLSLPQEDPRATGEAERQGHGVRR